MDRLIHLQFGVEEKANHVIVELHSGGNVVLTDADYRILNVLRRYTLEAGQGEDDATTVAVREVYPIHAGLDRAAAAEQGDNKAGRVQRAIAEEAEKEQKRHVATREEKKDETGVEAHSDKSPGGKTKGKKGGKKKQKPKGQKDKSLERQFREKKTTFKQMFQHCFNVGPQLVQHILLGAGVKPNGWLDLRSREERELERRLADHPGSQSNGLTLEELKGKAEDIAKSWEVEWQSFHANYPLTPQHLTAKLPCS